MLEKIGKLDLEELIGYSIASEESAIGFYKSLSAKTKSNQLVTRVFLNIITDEEAHLEQLMKLHGKIYGKKKVKTPKGLTPFESSAKVGDIGSLIDALGMAMQNESNAARVYMHIARTFPQHRAIFEQNAMMERGHYETLRLQKELYEDRAISFPDILTKTIAKALRDDA